MSQHDILQEILTRRGVRDTALEAQSAAQEEALGAGDIDISSAFAKLLGAGLAAGIAGAVGGKSAAGFTLQSGSKLLEEDRKASALRAAKRQAISLAEAKTQGDIALAQTEGISDLNEETRKAARDLEKVQVAQDFTSGQQALQIDARDRRSDLNRAGRAFDANILAQGRRDAAKSVRTEKFETRKAERKDKSTEATELRADRREELTENRALVRAEDQRIIRAGLPTDMKAESPEVVLNDRHVTTAVELRAPGKRALIAIRELKDILGQIGTYELYGRGALKTARALRKELLTSIQSLRGGMTPRGKWAMEIIHSRVPEVGDEFWALDSSQMKTLIALEESIQGFMGQTLGSALLVPDEELADLLGVDPPPAVTAEESAAHAALTEKIAVTKRELAELRGTN